MKKILAVVLSIIMAFSVAATAFAVNPPVFPNQTEETVYFSAENVFIEPQAEGTEPVQYTVPVYLVSNFTAPEDAAKVALGFMCFANGLDTEGQPQFDFINIVDVKMADEVQAYPGYELVECTYNAYDDSCGYVCFAADLSVLKEAKLHVADVIVEISDGFKGGDVSFGCIQLESYPLYWAPYESDWSTYGFENQDGGGFINADNEALPFTFDTKEGGNFFFTFGYLYEKPYEPTFKDKIVEWFKKLGLWIVDSILALINLIQGDMTA